MTLNLSYKLRNKCGPSNYSEVENVNELVQGWFIK